MEKKVYPVFQRCVLSMKETGKLVFGELVEFVDQIKMASFLKFL